MPSELERLTPREMDVLEMWGDGRTNIWIAEELGISRQTVQTFGKAIKKKFNTHTQHGAVAKAFRAGILK